MEFKARFLDLFEKLGVRSIKVLLFLRDPVSNACSSYQQLVKRGGHTGSLTDYLCNFARPVQVNQVLDFLKAVPNAEVTIHNYSACRSDVLTNVEDWLGLGNGALVRPPVDTVNRSLTRAELELQLCINRHMGQKCGGLLIDHLCNEAPDIMADDIRPPLVEQEAQWARLGDDIERVNSRVPVEARYSRDRDLGQPTNAGMDSELCFTFEQLDIIAHRLSEQFREMQRWKQKAKTTAALQARQTT